MGTVKKYALKSVWEDDFKIFFIRDTTKF